MGKSVLELFSQKEVLNYQKDRKYPALMERNYSQK